MLFTVYILYSPGYQKIYIGYTSDLLNRMRSHNIFGKGWTAAFRPWLVVYCEYFDVGAAAMKREKQLKSAAARKRIWEQVEKDFPGEGYISSL